MTQKEKNELSQVVCDLLTGNHLLGRKRSDLHKQLMYDYGTAYEKLKNNEPLTNKEKELFAEMGMHFYGGMEDMCEQLCIDYETLQKAMNKHWTSQELKQMNRDEYALWYNYHDLVEVERNAKKEAYNDCLQWLIDWIDKRIIETGIISREQLNELEEDFKKEMEIEDDGEDNCCCI